MRASVYIAGVGMTAFGRHLDRSIHSLVDEAVRATLTDAGAELVDIGHAFYSGVTQSQLQGQTAVPGQVVFARLGLIRLPVFNVENACASGASAFQLAVQALRAGACDVALAVGAEKMNIKNKSRALALFEGGWRRRVRPAGQRIAAAL
jgi:acetyl-CoA acetyltransferase